MVGIPSASAVFAWILSLVRSNASSSFARSLISPSISPVFAWDFSKLFGLLPFIVIDNSPISAKSWSFLRFLRPFNPVGLWLFAWCSSSAIAASGTMISG